jgi:hypothetical protein
VGQDAKILGKLLSKWSEKYSFNKAVWGDESGLALLPARVRTYAPRGQTPILRANLSSDHLSAIAAITPEGKLYMMVKVAPSEVPILCAFSSISCITSLASF